ncbi:DUF2157 domain-containing protein [Aquisalibacillus elongatus]|uniref:Putative membrane protein n=1 Tax=Aquisalibacillus elongatus TaxID=485577 RepID=A0A3N5BQM0_9BACI|nr:DUF2157 domain-containing protein [Aquisalibacillus elongatus]RPF52068.1 putative membrane protein [Aquisalibacillus elongatus]
MKRMWIQSESEKWVEEGIIDSTQRDKIVNRYSQKGEATFIFFFSAILIGLACLSFVAANWQVIPNLWRIFLIIFFMIGFYGFGSYLEEKGRSGYSVFCYIVALAVFGAGIFLTGQMYHYSMNSVFPFIIWGLAAFLLYLSRPYLFILLSGLAIVTIGEIYGLANMHAFDWWLFALFMIGYGTIVFIKKSEVLSWLFAIAFIIQLIGYSIEQLDQYYWMIIFSLVLYVVGTHFQVRQISRPFTWAPLLFMFGFTIVQSFIFSSPYRESIEAHFMFYFIWIVLASLVILFTLQNAKGISLTRLALFLPVFAAGHFAELVSFIVLYVFAIGLLLEGYQQIDKRKVHLGTSAFLISTLLVYIQVAWDFLDKSLFFLIGGIILFVIGFALERNHGKDV